MSFTTNKNLELVARGADVGVWDTPTNSNWSITDASFGGVATIALTNSPVTLSQAQYQCAFLIFAGALSGNCAITFPAIGSFYTVQNLTSNTSNFQVTCLTTASTGQTIGCPWGQATDIFTDGTNVKYRNLGKVGEYWDYCGSSVPAWVTACTVPPYLKCDGTSFSSATYPVLATIMGGTTLPDSKGRGRIALDEGAGRVSSAVSGVPGNTLLGSGGNQSLQSHNHNLTVTDPGHLHTSGPSGNTVSNGGTANVSAGGVGLLGPVAMNTINTGTATTGITAASSAAGAGSAQNMPPVYVGGITLICAA